VTSPSAGCWRQWTLIAAVSPTLYVWVSAQDAETHPVFVIGNLHGILSANGVLKSVDSLDADDIGAALLYLERFANRPVGGRFDGIILDESLAQRSVDGGPLDNLQREFLAKRLALGVLRIDRRLERFASHINRTDGADADRKRLGRKHVVRRRQQISLGQRDLEREHLGFAELAGGQLETDLALCIGHGGMLAVVGQLIADFAAGQRRSI